MERMHLSRLYAERQAALAAHVYGRASVSTSRGPSEFSLGDPVLQPSAAQSEASGALDGPSLSPHASAGSPPKSPGCRPATPGRRRSHERNTSEE